jgi:hypothetical protein
MATDPQRPSATIDERRAAETASLQSRATTRRRDRLILGARSPAWIGLALTPTVAALIWVV